MPKSFSCRHCTRVNGLEETVVVCSKQDHYRFCRLWLPPVWVLSIFQAFLGFILARGKHVFWMWIRIMKHVIAVYKDMHAHMYVHKFTDTHTHTHRYIYIILYYIILYYIILYYIILYHIILYYIILCYIILYYIILYYIILYMYT